MFGGSSNNNLSSPANDTQEEKSPTSATAPPNPASKSNNGVGSIPNGLDLDAVDEDTPASVARSQSLSLPRSSQDHGEKKRRSSGFGKAGALFANAKHSLHLSGSSNTESGEGQMSPVPSAIAKLGKTDPDLSVPQGSLNNSAGESKPGGRSTFKVGVTEDRNKKCRRTMEDTHAYLYNFLSTPAPNLPSDADSTTSGKKSEASKDGQDSKASTSSDHGIVETDNGYFAIFDGHAGTFAADWCGKKLHVLLEDAIRRNPNTPVPELLDQTFTSVDQQLDKLPLKNSGCTAICAVLRWEDRIPNSQSATGSTAIAPAAAAAVKAAASSQAAEENHKDSSTTPSAKAAVPGFASKSPMPKLQSSATRQRVLYTANVGDARIVLCRSGKALRLSYDHKGSDENEGKRISNAGGLILNNRVNGVLAVTRALGDSYMKELVTGHPYTTETVIQPDVDEFLILACDGLWDVCSDQEAVDLVRHTSDPQEASKMLVDHALSRFSTDNLSCMLVRFDSTALQKSLHSPPPSSTTGGSSTAIGVDDPSKPHPDESGSAGMSEVDAIVSEARRALGPKATEAEHKSLKEEVEEEEKGLEEIKSQDAPEVDSEALRRASRGSEKAMPAPQGGRKGSVV